MDKSNGEYLGTIHNPDSSKLSEVCGRASITN